MNTNESIMSELLAHVEQGKHRQFQFLRSWQEYHNAKLVRRAHKLLVISLSKSLKKQFKNYCKDITSGNTNVLKLIAYSTTDRILKFYEEDLNIINDMITEYECYLANGILLDFLFNSHRPDDKLWDHRRL
jgi:hypothetical protein